jgi:ribosomal protein L17
MAQAQEEANRTIALAREKADQMATRDSAVQEAQRRAEQIITQARADADATRRDADDYVVESLNHLKVELERLLNQVQNGIQTLEQDRMRQVPAPPPETPQTGV